MNTFIKIKREKNNRTLNILSIINNKFRYREVYIKYYNRWSEIIYQNIKKEKIVKTI